jgi:hypothetical protein
MRWSLILTIVVIALFIDGAAFNGRLRDRTIATMERGIELIGGVTAR